MATVKALTVLLATDGSPQGEVATAMTAAVRWPEGTLIEVLRANEPFAADLELPPNAYAALQDAIQADIDKQIAATIARLARPGVLVRGVVPVARAATAIVDEARKVSADLAILGSRGRGRLASMLLGSVAAEVTDRAPCPVLVARTAKLGRIVVATDGSMESAAAVEIVASWPIFQGVDARVVSVAPVPARTALGPVMRDEASQAYAEAVDALRAMYGRISHTASARLADAGIDARTEVRCGDAAEEIVGAAADDQADLIVVGSRGRTGLERLFLGSVARNVLLEAPCSVLITRRTVAR